MSEEQGEVELGGITATLDELVKAADATEIVKAYGGTNVEWSGHVDERGKVAGGGAGGGDVGGLDDMMIGKMAQSLIDQGFEAGEIQAFMSAKQEDEDEEDEEDMYGEMEEAPLPPRRSRTPRQPRRAPAPGPDRYPSGQRTRMHRSGGYDVEGDPMVKAMDEFRQDSDVADAIDVSPFLEALTARTADQLDGIHKSLRAHRGQTAHIQRHTAAAIHQIGTLQKSMADILGALNERLNLIERQPAQPRGVTSMTGARALHKSMHGEAGAPGVSLSKAEVVGALSYMNLEKGIRDIGGTKTGTAAMLLEGGGSLDQQTLDAVNGFLAAHPAEAEAARNYR